MSILSNILGGIRRAVTLPKRRNSLADIVGADLAKQIDTLGAPVVAALTAATRAKADQVLTELIASATHNLGDIRQVIVDTAKGGGIPASLLPILSAELDAKCTDIIKTLQAEKARLLDTTF